jgi:phosphoserine aminotransferase
VGLRTLTPFGYGAWLRASLYTGVTLEQAEALAAFMRCFAQRWQAKGPRQDPGQDAER